MEGRKEFQIKVYAQGWQEEGNMEKGEDGMWVFLPYEMMAPAMGLPGMGPRSVHYCTGREQPSNLHTRGR